LEAAFCASAGPLADLISVISRSARKLVKKLIKPDYRNRSAIHGAAWCCAK
jgi:hypothetical protein